MSLPQIDTVMSGKDSEGFPGIYPLFIPWVDFFLHNGIVGCGLQDRDRLARHVAPAECRVIVNAQFF